METVYRLRGRIASAPSVLLLVSAVMLTSLGLPRLTKPPVPPPVRIVLAPPVPEAPPTPPVPETPPPQPLVPPPVVVEPPPVAKPKLPVPHPAPPRPTQSPTPASPVPDTAPPAVESTAPTEAVPVRPPVATATVPPRPAVASADDAYAAQLKAYLEAVKHYPTSKEARLQRPRGEVEIWFVLDRAGTLKDAGIGTSSGSLILDGAALALVRGAGYQPFQPDAFQGQTTHRFTVTLNYTLS